MTRFQDRSDAGRALVPAIRTAVGHAPAVVLALPCGGVPVAAPVAAALGAPLDVVVVVRLGVPGHPDLAMGAVASGDVVVRNDAVLAGLPAAAAQFDALAAGQLAEVARRERAFRHDGAPRRIAGRTVVLVDDGVATGATMRAAVRACRRQRAARVLVAAPVASRDAVDLLATVADEVIVLEVPRTLGAVSAWYAQFPPVADAAARALLAAQASTEGQPA